MSDSYVFQPYPRHVHKPHGEFFVVHDDAERDAKVAEGWFLTPLEAELSLQVGGVSGEGTGEDLAAAIGLEAPKAAPAAASKKRRTH